MWLALLGFAAVAALVGGLLWAATGRGEAKERNMRLQEGLDKANAVRKVEDDVDGLTPAGRAAKLRRHEE